MGGGMAGSRFSRRKRGVDVFGLRAFGPRFMLRCECTLVAIDADAGLGLQTGGASAGQVWMIWGCGGYRDGWDQGG